jgi:hypothetical protein
MPYHVSCFTLGTIAPDCFERSDNKSFRAYHFVRTDCDSDLDFFLGTICPAYRSYGVLQSSYVAGYYAHLWLDNFVRANEDALLVTPSGFQSPDELWTLVKANIECYNLRAIADFLSEIEPVVFIRVPKFEFVSHERVMQSWRQLLSSYHEAEKQSEQAVAIEENQYRQFLLNAVDHFIRNFPTVLSLAA